MGKDRQSSVAQKRNRVPLKTQNPLFPSLLYLL
jgi:hypothetical protein